MSASERTELAMDLERTRATIIDLLKGDESNPCKLNITQRRDHEWDLWVVVGILEHGLTI